MLKVGAIVIPVMGTWSLFDTTQLTRALRTRKHMLRQVCIKIIILTQKVTSLDESHITMCQTRCVPLDNAHCPNSL